MSNARMLDALEFPNMDGYFQGVWVQLKAYDMLYEQVYQCQRLP